MSTYLVTGGAGFIGSHVCRLLVDLGEKVRVLDDLSTGRIENLEDVGDGVEFVRGDIRDLGLLREVMEGVDFVVHEAAIASVVRSVEDPLEVESVNVGGTLNVLLSAKDAGVKRVVFPGSASAYGNSPFLPKTEDMAPEPLSPYAASKLAGEHYCRAFYETYGLEAVVLRYFNVFGPRQDPDSPYSGVISIFLGKLLRGEEIVIFGDGEQTRDFVFVEDVARATVSACEAEGAAGEVFNIGRGEEVKINDLAEAVMEVTGVEGKVVHGPPRPGDVRASLADITKAEKLLGYSPRVSLKEGLARTAEWFRRKYGEKAGGVLR